ncbi:MAG: outer membrane lipid asymmetry maintenance protein MlaD [Deltaproteobacteria bacterium]|nr:outer membrane lipid asymmetry maintenance protein MlaD [Deltaproteobacteria bacterium]
MKKYSQEVIVGVFVLIGLLCIGYMSVKLGNLSIFGDNANSFYARFTSVAGLKVGNSVEMLGMEIGRVAEFKMDQENQVAIVELRVKEGIKIYDDAIASIKTAGLIGEKYVSIDPGGADELLKPGATITDTNAPVDIGDLISKYAFGDVEK